MNHDVFINFCGKDTESFASHLYKALTKARVSVFNDRDKLISGDLMPPSVLRAIEASRICIIIFSRHFADSMWCLEALEKIMECHRTKSQAVLPVFYDVEPSDVQNQKGMFGESFEELVKRMLVEKDKLRSWRVALTEASNISIFFMMYSRNESKDTKNVVQRVTRLLDICNTYSFPARHVVGVQSRVQEVLELLNNQQSKYPLLLGIWGMGGIGKTVLAVALYNQIGHFFEGTSFLRCVRETWSQHGEISLQQQLLSDIFGPTKIEIGKGESGKMILKERLKQKKIFLVLDVDELEQMKSLCGGREWFGAGSRIIITTRNRHLLNVFGVDHVYRVNELDKNASIELFCQRAFEQPSSPGIYVQLAQEVLAYCKGLPLALKVIGSLMHRKRRNARKSQLIELNRRPNTIVNGVLKLSFDKLNSEEKAIFLDITCFFVGMGRNEVIHRFNTSTQVTEHVISALQDKALLTIDENDKLGMHPLLQGMGREIIREESQMKFEPKIYDVFLSFRGRDTRASFVSHLYTSLENAGIYVFRDDDEIQRGDQISFSLIQSIGSSKVAVIVLSRNYANSRWCMTELEKIVQHCKNIVPVFYEVDPSDVRNQTGEFGNAFKDLKTKILVDKNKWKTWEFSLLEVGGKAGIVVINSRNESEDIQKVVEHVTNLLDNKDLFVADHPVGLESRVQDVIQLLYSHQSKYPSVMGIWGMGGIGKTTIAKATYNKIRRNFEAKCILLNVREVWEQNNGQVSLQQRLLSDIYKTTKIKIDTVESGKMILKERLSQKRIFLLLDDVNELDQMRALCGGHDWFGKGSTIIITTRNDSLLRELEFIPVYSMEAMDENESFELFSWHAFKQSSPREGFDILSRDVVKYCGGLPLALQVIGSFLLSRCRKTTEWESVLEKLNIIPDQEVLRKLRISFDGLCDDDVKDIFLDIAF